MHVFLRRNFIDVRYAQCAFNLVRFVMLAINFNVVVVDTLIVINIHRFDICIGANDKTMGNLDKLSSLNHQHNQDYYM